MKQIKLRNFTGGDITVSSSLGEKSTTPLLLHNCYPDKSGYLRRRSDTVSELATGVVGVYEDQAVSAYITRERKLFLGTSFHTATDRGYFYGETYYFLRIGGNLFMSSDLSAFVYNFEEDTVSLWDVPPMENLCFFRGSIWGSWGNYIRRTKPTILTEEEERGYVELEEKVMMVCATGDVLVVGTERSHYLLYSQDGQMRLRRVLRFGAFRGSAAYDRNDRPMWLTPRGVAKIGEHGIEVAHMDGIRLRLHGSRIHAAIDEIDGVSQYIGLTPVYLGFKDLEIQSILNDVELEDLGG